MRSCRRRSRAVIRYFIPELALYNSGGFRPSRRMNRQEEMDGELRTPISLENARKAAAPALAEARKQGWSMAVAIVDAAGTLVYFEKMDDTQKGSAQVCIAKARSAALFKRPTKDFQDTLAAGGEGLRVLRLEGAMPVKAACRLWSTARLPARSACQAARVPRMGNVRRRARRRFSRSRLLWFTLLGSHFSVRVQVQCSARRRPSHGQLTLCLRPFNTRWTMNGPTSHLNTNRQRATEKREPLRSVQVLVHPNNT